MDPELGLFSREPVLELVTIRKPDSSTWLPEPDI
jgi:hypothetical protein